MKKQNIAIIGVVAFILAVAVGYALFSDTLTISGTATAKGDFDVEFTSVGEIKKVGYTETNDSHGDGTEANIAVISADKNTLTITVNKLDYPGAYVEIPVTITNKGSIPAKLKNIKETNVTGGNTVTNNTGSIAIDSLDITYTGVAASDATIDTNATQSMIITVKWNEDKETSVENAQFKIELEYEQVTATTAGA